MLKRSADNREPGSLAVQMRKRRHAFFRSLLSRLPRPIHILDIGVTDLYWSLMGFSDEERIFVTLLNLSKFDVSLPNMTSIAGDARDVNARDASFDVVFSNSVIEHVGTHEDQMQMANEVRRVGNRYFVQTPNKYFPLEPHFLFPFFQFLPLRIQVLLLQNFNLGWFKKTPNELEARELAWSIRLLSKREFVALFPNSKLYEEKIFGLTKSYAVYGGWDE